MQRAVCIQSIKTSQSEERVRPCSRISKAYSELQNHGFGYPFVA